MIRSITGQSLLDHLDKLNILKQDACQYVCECPICEGHRLTIAKNSGAYQCWSGGCDTKEIWRRVVPQQEQSYSPPRQPSKPVKQAAKPAPLPGEIIFAQLSSPATDSPQPEKGFDREHGEVERITYKYGPDQWKTRNQWEDSTKEKGYDKDFEFWHRNSTGKAIARKGSKPFLPYRWDEAIGAAQTTGANFLTAGEGEKVVEALRQAGLAGITLSSFSQEEIRFLAQSLKSQSLGLIYIEDNDDAGRKKAAKLREACDRAGVPFIAIDPTHISPNLPESGDVADILTTMKVPDFIRALEAELHRAINQRLNQVEEGEMDSPTTGTEITQQVYNILYGDCPWVTINGVLHRWTGTHYEASPDCVEIPRIARLLNTWAVPTPNGIRFPYANPNTVEKTLKWIKMLTTVDPCLVNPPGGINCTNGVLVIEWNGSEPSWRLVEHDSARIYTYKPLIDYRPDADPTQCDRILEALDTEQQSIFLGLVAASLDLPTVRQYKGRLIRAALLKGDGSNGKDTLRELVAMLHGGQGLTGCSLTDFKQYDEGRKFPLNKLQFSRVNWSSENSDVVRLDRLQSLKAAITGDELDFESKSKDERSGPVNAVFFFNCNDTPNLKASLEAIQSRYTVLSFNKTFKIGADASKGELEADPRFKYDREFIRTEVMPAFLNRVLVALVALMQDGIDYNPTIEALQAIQQENSHLFQFCQDVGLEYDPNGEVLAGEIWTKLRAWYIDNGTLNIEISNTGKEKNTWIDQVKPGDRNVKGANQIVPRFLELFPKAKRGQKTERGVVIKGLSFRNPTADAVSGASDTHLTQHLTLEPLPDKVADAPSPVLLIPHEQETERINSNPAISDRTKEEPVTKTRSTTSVSIPSKDSSISNCISTVSASSETASTSPPCRPEDQVQITAEGKCQGQSGVIEQSTTIAPVAAKVDWGADLPGRNELSGELVEEISPEAILPCQPPQLFQLGERVRVVVKGKYLGRIGAICKIDPNMDRPYLVMFDGGGFGRWRSNFLAAIAAETSGAIAT